LNGTFINFVKVKEEQLQDGDTLTLGGGAGLEEGERSDCLASDLVFRFEAPDENMPLSAPHVHAPTALNSLDPNVISAPTPERERPKTASAPNGPSSESGAASLGDSSLGKRLNEIHVKPDDGVVPPEKEDSTSNKRQRVSRSPVEEDKANVELNANLKDEFKCAVCQDFFVQATTLNCGHTFCNSCITEWFSRSQKCPTCRTQCSSRPVNSNALDCAVRHIVRSDPQTSREYEVRLDKAAREKASQRRSLESLAKRIESAKEGDNQFLRITTEWNEEERVTFDSGVNNYRGIAREEYCRATGLTEEFLEVATVHELALVARNVRLSGQHHRESTDSSVLRRRLHMFIMFG
jgi:hypothetical protein